jgi:hypothetical protein
MRQTYVSHELGLLKVYDVSGCSRCRCREEEEEEEEEERRSLRLGREKGDVCLSGGTTLGGRLCGRVEGRGGVALPLIGLLLRT